MALVAVALVLRWWVKNGLQGPDGPADWMTGVTKAMGQNLKHINDFYEGRFWL